MHRHFGRAVEMACVTQNFAERTRVPQFDTTAWIEESLQGLNADKASDAKASLAQRSAPSMISPIRL
jgi:hypothetical protein